MKLNHYLFSAAIDFDIGSVQQLIFENPSDLSRMVTELIEQCRGKEGRFILSEIGQEILVDKAVTVITDPYNLDAFHKLVISGISAKLTSMAISSEYQQRTSDVLHSVECLLDDLLSNLESDILFESIGVADLLKVSNVVFPKESDIQSSLFDTVRLIAKYCKKRLVVLVSCSSYLSFDDLQSLISGLKYLNFPILIIDSKVVEGTGYKLFDKGFCELNKQISHPNIFEV